MPDNVPCETQSGRIRMPTKKANNEGADRFIASLAKAEKTAIEAVRDFVDTVNRAFPDKGDDGGHRQHIIDSAFKMTDQLVGASNELAHRVVTVGHGAAKHVPGHKTAARKPVARKKTATKRT